MTKTTIYCFIAVALITSSIYAELPLVEFSIRSNPSMEDFSAHLGDYTSYVQGESGKQPENSVYNSVAKADFPQAAPFYNENVVAQKFSGNWMSYCNAGNEKFLEALLAQKYHVYGYFWQLQKNIAISGTIIGYNREQQVFLVQLDKGQEVKYSYSFVTENLQFAELKNYKNIHNWDVQFFHDGKNIHSAVIESCTFEEALNDAYNSGQKVAHLKKAKCFVNIIPEGTRGWGGEQQFRAIRFSGTSYNTLAEQIVTIYISDSNVQGCHLTRYTVDEGKYSDNINEGNVYVFSTNPVQVYNGSASFQVRCKVSKKSATPWWVEAMLYYRLYTPDN